jgi:hypothetical protein
MHLLLQQACRPTSRALIRQILEHLRQSEDQHCATAKSEPILRYLYTTVTTLPPEELIVSSLRILGPPGGDSAMTIAQELEKRGYDRAMRLLDEFRQHGLRIG